MANKFQFKRTSVSGRTPNTTNLANTSYIDAGEFAVNLADQKVFTSNGSAYFEIGSNLASLSVQSITANGTAGTNGQVLTSNGSAVYWGAGSAGTLNATQATFTYTIVANTSSITGADDDTVVLNYTPGLESVYINGSRQIAGEDYTTTNSSVITLTSNAINGDVIQVVTFAGVVSSVNVNAQYVWSNTHTFGNTVTFNGAISANGSLGTSGQILASNGTAVYWSSPNPGDITGVTAGNGLSGGGTSGDVTVSVLANTGLVSNSSGLFVAGDQTLGNTTVTDLLTTTQLRVNTNTSISSSWDDIVVGNGTNDAGITVFPGSSYLGGYWIAANASASGTASMGMWSENPSQKYLNISSYFGKVVVASEPAGYTNIGGGAVGINYSSPIYSLDVSSKSSDGANNIVMRLIGDRNSGTPSLSSSIMYQDGLTGVGWLAGLNAFGYTGGDGSAFQIGNKDIGVGVTITNNGRLGVSNSTPNHTLSVGSGLAINNTGSVTSSDLADAVGYKGIPQNSQTAQYTLALSDMGKHISITTGGVVIPANGTVAFPIGATIVVFNNSASTQTISITTDTLRQAGTTNTGTRTLAAYGVATLLKVTSTVWVVSGNIT